MNLWMLYPLCFREEDELMIRQLLGGDHHWASLPSHSLFTSFGTSCTHLLYFLAFTRSIKTATVYQINPSLCCHIARQATRRSRAARMITVTGDLVPLLWRQPMCLHRYSNRWPRWWEMVSMMRMSYSPTANLANWTTNWWLQVVFLLFSWDHCNFPLVIENPYPEIICDIVSLCDTDYHTLQKLFVRK